MNVTSGSLHCMGNPACTLDSALPLTYEGAVLSNQIKTLEEFIEIRNLLESSQMIRAAISTGVLSALSDGQKTAPEISEQAGLNCAAVTLLLESLVQVGVLEQYELHYALSPAAKLLPADGQDGQYWAHLTEYLKTGQSLAQREDLPDSDLLFEADQTRDQWMRTPSAMDAATALNFGKSRRGLRVLEVGCGSGIFSATFAHRDPDSTFVLLDTPANLAQARATVESINLSPQFDYVESDELFPTSEIGGFDLVLLTGQLHRKSLDWFDQWCKRVRDLIHVEGELVLADVFAGQEKGARNLAIFAMQVGLRTEQGQVHSAASVQQALKSNSFGQIQFAHLPSPPFVWGLVVAARD